MTFQIKLKKLNNTSRTRMKYDLDKLKDPNIAAAF
jgi:hypothetical protein